MAKIFGKKFTDAPLEIIAPAAKLAFVPLVVPMDEKEVVSTIAPGDDFIQESLKSFEKLAEKLEEKGSLKTEEKQPEKVDVSIVEKVEEILPIDEPIIEKIEEIELPKEEKKELEKLKEKPFVSFFSLEQLKRIFGKKD